MVFTRRPGRVKTCLDVDLPRPRELSIKRDRRFLDYEDRIWSSIEEEVRQPEGGGTGNSFEDWT
jgi:NitT/TauT family transport system ATP-binding protein